MLVYNKPSENETPKPAWLRRNECSEATRLGRVAYWNPGRPHVAYWDPGLPVRAVSPKLLAAETGRRGLRGERDGIFLSTLYSSLPAEEPGGQRLIPVAIVMPRGPDPLAVSSAGRSGCGRQYAGLDGMSSARGAKKAVPSSSWGRYLCSGAPSVRAWGATARRAERGGPRVSVRHRPPSPQRQRGMACRHHPAHG